MSCFGTSTKAKGILFVIINVTSLFLSGLVLPPTPGTGTQNIMTKQTKSRNYVFTINNYDAEILKKFTHIAESLQKHKYICYGLEVAPTTGMKHIQGYIQLSDNQGFKFLHNYFDLEKDGKQIKFHIQPANGTLKENQTYTSKAGEWFEYGVPKRAGRSDLTNLRNLISEKPWNLRNIIREECTNLQQVRYVEILQKYQFTQRDPDTPPKVFWIYGSTGIGKSKLAYDSFESVCAVSDLKWPGDNYNQEECLLIDDYREEDMKFNVLLRITDRYPYKLAVKGSSVELNSPFIVITSPYSIDNAFKFINEDLEQLRRRLVAEIHLDTEKVQDLKEYMGLDDI